jgi:hypothetical protein
MRSRAQIGASGLGQFIAMVFHIHLLCPNVKDGR